jgi:hypothetical protein
LPLATIPLSSLRSSWLSENRYLILGIVGSVFADYT